jgi:hypothetical protein
MKKRLTSKQSLLLLIIPVTLAVQFRILPQSFNDTTISNQVPTNEYILQMLDKDNNPIPDAIITYWYVERRDEGKFDSAYSDKMGRVIIALKSTDNSEKRLKVYFTVFKDGYCLYEDEIEPLELSKDEKINSMRAKARGTTTNEPKRIILQTLEDSKIGFNIKVIGHLSNPIENVNLTIIGMDNRTGYNAVASTNLNGVYEDTIYSYCTESGVKRVPLKITAEKEGYFSQDIDSEVEYGEENSNLITLIAETDYLREDFLNSSESKLLAANITSFITYLILKSLLSDCIIEYYSIYLEKFKGNKYLSITFKNVNEYNSLKLNHYDIGKQMFDEVVRKVLTPLNENLGGYTNFFGYKLVINTTERNFGESINSGKELEYIFYMSQKSVMAYKNLDITGQQLIDASVILLDGERIDLKLQ